ncbi:sugar-binding protein, partial [Chryseobacterium sp. P1-3]
MTTGRKNYTYYDTKGRVIGTHSINHLGGYTKTESKLDFAGVAQQVVTRHKRLDTDTERIITENFEYDSQNRLLVHRHQVDNNPEEILAQNTYNELSQLTNKKVGNNLQSIDYAYNIRGWMTRINDPANLNGKLFGYEIKYTNPVYTNLASGRFNGNIAEVDWRNSSEDVLKRYSYTYDGLNRLKDGIYTEPNATNPYNNNFNEHLTYDTNGNIMTLKRNA